MWSHRWAKGKSIFLLFSHLSCIQLFVIPWTAAHQASLSFTIFQSLLKIILWMGDAIQPSHPLLFLSPTALTFSQHQDLFQWVSSSHQVVKVLRVSASASVLPMNIQGWFPLGLTGLISLQSKRLSRVFSSTTIQKHQLSGTQPSLWSNSHIHTWLLEKPQL